MHIHMQTQCMMHVAQPKCQGKAYLRWTAFCFRMSQFEAFAREALGFGVGGVAAAPAAAGSSFGGDAFLTARAGCRGSTQV